MLAGLFVPSVSQSCHLSVLHLVPKYIVQLRGYLRWTGFNSWTCGLGHRNVGPPEDPPRRPPYPLCSRISSTSGKPSPSTYMLFTHRELCRAGCPDLWLQVLIWKSFNVLLSLCLSVWTCVSLPTSVHHSACLHLPVPEVSSWCKCCSVRTHHVSAGLPAGIWELHKLARGAFPPPSWLGRRKHSQCGWPLLMAQESSMQLFVLAPAQQRGPEVS